MSRTRIVRYAILAAAGTAVIVLGIMMVFATGGKPVTTAVQAMTAPHHAVKTATAAPRAELDR